MRSTSLLAGKCDIDDFSVATNEYRGGNGTRTVCHACMASDRLAEICGQFLSKGQLVAMMTASRPANGMTTSESGSG
jgi:hypothetical protein